MPEAPGGLEQEPDLSTIHGVPATASIPDLGDIKGANTIQHSIEVSVPGDAATTGE